MKHNVRFLVALALLACQYIAGKHVIMLHFKEYPSFSACSQGNFPNKKLDSHGNHAVQRACTFFESGIASGILATYFGYIDVSDLNGNITFPREHEKPLLNLIITPRISPVMMFSKTVHHWELEAGQQVLAYVIERKEDKDTKLLFWDVQEAYPPKNNRLPLNTIIILASPQDIYVPTGITLTNTNPQLILPDIYIKKGISRVTGPLDTLNVKHFFGSVYYLQKTEDLYYVSQIAT